MRKRERERRVGRLRERERLTLRFHLYVNDDNNESNNDDDNVTYTALNLCLQSQIKAHTTTHIFAHDYKEQLEVRRMVIKLRVPDQNGVSLRYIMLEIPHSGQEFILRKR